MSDELTQELEKEAAALAEKMAAEDAAHGQDEVLAPKGEEPAEPPQGPLAEPLTIEKLAATWGWNPKYQGPGAKTADDYVRAEREISTQRREEIQNLKSRMDRLGKFFQSDTARIKAEADAAKKQLMEARREAIKEGDVERVELIETEIHRSDENVRRAAGQVEAVAAPVAPEVTTESNPFYDTFVRNNDWYLKDEAMTVYADYKWNNDSKIVALKEKDPPSAYRAIEEIIKGRYPDKFNDSNNGQRTAVAPSLESGASRSATQTAKAAPSVGALYNSLDRDTRELCDDAVRLGGITKADFIKGLIDQGVLK